MNRVPKRVLIVTLVYAFFAITIWIYMYNIGALKGAIFGRVVGFLTAVSVVSVYFISHSKEDRNKMLRKHKESTEHLDAGSKPRWR